MITLYIGYDPREACVYHTFCQSVIVNKFEVIAHNADLELVDNIG